MSDQHTQGELCTAANYPHGKTSICTHTGTGWVEIGTAKTEADARRLVACWNACDGLPIDLLEEVSVMKIDARIRQERDDLLKALKHINSAACYASEVATETREAMLLHIGQTARAAIAKVEGGAA